MDNFGKQKKSQSLWALGHDRGSTVQSVHSHNNSHGVALSSEDILFAMLSLVGGESHKPAYESKIEMDS